jgi:hypothetical protein
MATIARQISARIGIIFIFLIVFAPFLETTPQCFLHQTSMTTLGFFAGGFCKPPQVPRPEVVA